jgi:hypothetical protein
VRAAINCDKIIQNIVNDQESQPTFMDYLHANAHNLSLKYTFSCVEFSFYAFFANYDSVKVHYHNTYFVCKYCACM